MPKTYATHGTDLIGSCLVAIMICIYFFKVEGGLAFFKNTEHQPGLSVQVAQEKWGSYK